MLNSTHCSSSQEFDEVSNTLRTMALTADTNTAARMSQDSRLPSQVLMASIRRLNGSSASRIESTSGPRRAACVTGRFAASPRSAVRSASRASPANPKGPAAVN